MTVSLNRIASAVSFRHPTNAWPDDGRVDRCPGDEILEDDRALDDWLLSNVRTQHHFSGTCKMGPADDPLAVVDQSCRVHGLENLMVVDASIMPDVIRANTNATTIMIAEKIADEIRGSADTVSLPV